MPRWDRRDSPHRGGWRLGDDPSALRWTALSAGPRLPLLLAAALAVAHSLTTARAAPINWSQRSAADDELVLAGIFQRFEQWQTARAVLQLATFLAIVWALFCAQGTIRS
jgi:hypothetical protein